MAKRKIASINSIFIHHDDKNRSIYWDIFTQKGYLLTNDDVTKYMLDKFSLPIAGILSYALIQFKVKALISILIGASLYIICKILWRVLFLYKCTIVKTFNKGSLSQRIDELSNKYNKTRLTALIVLCVPLIGIMAYSLFAYELEHIYFYLLIILIALAFVLLIFAFILLSKKK